MTSKTRTPFIDYLSKLKSHVFSVLNKSHFNCDTYELAKSHRITYSHSLNKSIESFVVIHLDVWRPAKIPSISKTRYFVTFFNECTRMTWIILKKIIRW